jgi:hypothetical protein
MRLGWKIIELKMFVQPLLFLNHLMLVYYRFLFEAVIYQLMNKKYSYLLDQMVLFLLDLVEEQPVFLQEETHFLNHSYLHFLFEDLQYQE